MRCRGNCDYESRKAYLQLAVTVEVERAFSETCTMHAQGVATPMILY